MIFCSLVWVENSSALPLQKSAAAVDCTLFTVHSHWQYIWYVSLDFFLFKFLISILWLQKMSLFLVAEIIRTMGRSDGAIVTVKQKIYNPKNDLFLFSSIRCEHLRPANNFFRHNKWRCVWFSDFLPPPTATLMRVSAIHDSLTPGYDENCPSLAVWFTRGHVPRVPALAVWWGLCGRADLFPVAALLLITHIVYLPSSALADPV